MELDNAVYYGNPNNPQNLQEIDGENFLDTLKDIMKGLLRQVLGPFSFVLDNMEKTLDLDRYIKESSEALEFIKKSKNTLNIKDEDDEDLIAAVAILNKFSASHSDILHTLKTIKAQNKGKDFSYVEEIAPLFADYKDPHNFKKLDKLFGRNVSEKILGEPATHDLVTGKRDPEKYIENSLIGGIQNTIEDMKDKAHQVANLKEARENLKNLKAHQKDGQDNVEIDSFLNMAQVDPNILKENKKRQREFFDNELSHLSQYFFPSTEKEKAKTPTMPIYKDAVFTQKTLPFLKNQNPDLLEKIQNLQDQMDVQNTRYVFLLDVLHKHNIYEESWMQVAQQVKDNIPGGKEYMAKMAIKKRMYEIV